MGARHRGQRENHRAHARDRVQWIGRRPPALGDGRSSVAARKSVWAMSPDVSMPAESGVRSIGFPIRPDRPNLDIDVRNPDNGRMENSPEVESSIQDFARIFGPVVGPMPAQPAVSPTHGDAQPLCTDAARNAANRQLLIRADEAEFARHLLEIVAAGLRRPVAEVAGDAGEDAWSLEIDSMTAVFVCTVVADVLGPEGMCSLRGRCEPEDLSTIGSVARLLCRLRRTEVRQ